MNTSFSNDSVSESSSPENVTSSESSVSPSSPSLEVDFEIDARFLPMTRAEMDARGWDEVDVVFVTGDAYVDHPSFATALLGRVLEDAGLKVAILAQPNWKNAEPWKTFGRPRLGFCISAGNMDSMINHYTANRKVRNDDAYSPDGEIGHRPDRATLSYSQRAREAFPGVTVIVGGVEASLRRLAHYDYWSDKVKRSILMDSKADLLVYGMGEQPLLEIVRGLNEGKTIRELSEVRGTVYRLGATEDLPPEDETTLHLPSCEEVTENKDQFLEMTRLAYLNLNPYSAKRLVQEHDLEAIVVNPPAMPLTEEELDRIYALPFTRKPHPSYAGREIPAYKVIKDSVQILRGCFGGCAFCSLTAHQGKFVQSRSEKSVCAEVRLLSEAPDFKGTISDLGGPTANMYRLGCTRPELMKTCQRISCLHPNICPHLATDHAKVIQLMRSVREIPGVKKVFIASGVRTDLALKDEAYLEELVRHHVGGHLKTAPEHADPEVLQLMNKPPIENYMEFCETFTAISHKCGKEQYLVPYMIAGLPGSDLASMVRVAEFLRDNGIRPQQVQEFIPGPFELATAMYYTGKDPISGKKVHVARGLRERRLQKALLMYYDPDFYYDVKTALREAGREDLIGNGPECLVQPYPSKMDSLRQSSRLKRLTRKEMKEKKEKTERREQLQRENEERKRAQNAKNRSKSARPRESRPFRERPDRPYREQRSGEPRPFRERSDRDRPNRDRPNREYSDRDRPNRDRPNFNREKPTFRDGNRGPRRDDDRRRNDENRSSSERPNRDSRERRPEGRRPDGPRRFDERGPRDQRSRERRDGERRPDDRGGSRERRPNGPRRPDGPRRFGQDGPKRRFDENRPRNSKPRDHQQPKKPYHRDKKDEKES